MTNIERSTLIKGSAAIAISAVLWGVDGVVLTPSLFNLDVGYVVFVLHAFPFLLMHLFFAKQYRFIGKMPRQDVITFLLISLLGGAIGTLAIVKALFLLDFIHLSIVVLLQKLQPVFAILLARTILGEKLKQRFIQWASLAIFASYFLTFGWARPDFDTDSNTIYAASLALLAAFSFGSSTVLSKKILGNYSFVTSTFYRYGFTSLIMLVYMIFLGDFGQFQQTTNENWMYIVIIGLTTGSGAIFLYYYGLRKVKAILATISELMFPLSAVIFDYFINGSVLSYVQWIAAALMLFAIFRLNAEPEKIS